MDKYVELIKLLESIFGKGSVSRTIGTRTNVLRFPKGKQGLNPTKSEFDVEGTAAKNPDLVQTIENSIADRMGDITQMNDQELLTYTANVRRLVNFKKPPELPNADVVKFGSGEEIKGEGLEKLIQKQGTKNPPTTVAGRLETQLKKLEKAGEDLKEVTEKKPESVIGNIMKDYSDFQNFMQSSQKTGYVRATVRQIMREDIQAGKLKLPKELEDQVMQGLGEPIDIYRKVYGEGALEQIDSIANDLGQFRTEEEAAKFARSKFTFEPDVNRTPGSYTIEEDPSKIKNISKELDKKKTPNELIDEYNKNKERLSLTDEQGGTAIGYEEFQNLKNRNKEIEEALESLNVKPIKPEPEGKADGGRIGFNKGKRVLTEIDKLIEKLNKKTKGKKSMESVDPKTGEVTVPKKPIRRAEEPTGMTTMDPEPETIDERAITKNKSRKLTQDEIADYEELIGRDSEQWMSEGTVEEAEKALKRSKAEEAYYLQQYKTGQLDPKPGEKSQSRMRFLQKKAEEAADVKDKRLFSLDESDELDELERTFNKKNTSTGGFSFNDPEIKTQMEKAMQEGNKRSKEMRAMGLDPAKSKDYDEYIKIKEASGDKNFNKYFDDLEIKTKFKGVISDDLLNQILIDDNPQRKAEVIATIEEGLKMQEKGMSPEQIIDILKNTTRTKQAEGGIAGLI